MHQLQLAAQYTALGVEVFHIHLQGFQLGIAQESGWARH